MLPYQERVIEEKKQLSERLQKLTEFIFSGQAFDSLPKEERQRLVRQMNIMSEYSIVLLERIVAFEQKE